MATHWLVVKQMTVYCNVPSNHSRVEFTLEDLRREFDRLASLYKLPTIYIVILRKDSSRVDSDCHFKVFESTSIDEATLAYNVCVKNKLANESFALYYIKDYENFSAPIIVKEC